MCFFTIKANHYPYNSANGKIYKPKYNKKTNSGVKYQHNKNIDTKTAISSNLNTNTPQMHAGKLRNNIRVVVITNQNGKRPEGVNVVVNDPYKRPIIHKRKLAVIKC